MEASPEFSYRFGPFHVDSGTRLLMVTEAAASETPSH